MFDRILKLIWEKIIKNEYIMTLHAEEEMDYDDLNIYDVESCILTGKIVERQRDKVTAELPYRINGRTLSGGTAEVIAKISPTGKLVFITVYVPEN